MMTASNDMNVADGRATLLTCQMDDPADGVCRVLMLLSRCGIGLLGLTLERGPAGRYSGRFSLAEPLPFSAAQLCDRVAAIPALAGTPPAVGQTPMSGSLSSVQPAIRQLPSPICRMT